MSLADVVAALNESISSGQIDLYTASGKAALAPLRPMLARFTITSSFVLSAARLSPGATSATLTGTGTWGLAGAPAQNITTISAKLDCVATGGNDVRFTLTLTMAQSGWTFGKTFAGLPQTMLVQDQAVKPGPSFLTNIRLDNAAFTTSSDPNAGMTLNGSLPMATFWQPWRSLIGPWPLQLYGAVEAPASYNQVPVLDLLATAGGSTIPLQNTLLNLAGLALADVGFGLVSTPGPDPNQPNQDAFSVLNLTGRLQIGGLVARLTCPILATGTLWHFLVEFEQGGGIVEGMNQLAKLFGLPELPTPPNFLPIPNFRFSSIEFYIEPNKTLTDFTVSYIAVAIESDKPWTSPLPFITLDKVGISWLWGQTPLKDTDIGWLAATVYGTVAFGTDAPFHIDGAVQIPGWTATAELRQGDVIPITSAFREYFGTPGPTTPSDMNIVGLAIDADPQEQSYYATADIFFGTPPSLQIRYAPDGGVLIDDPDPPPPQGWTINLVVTQITLRSLTFHVSVVGGELSGGIGAVFLFGDGDGDTRPAFMLSAEYPGPAATNPEGWTFAGELLPGASIELRDLVKQFLGQTTVPSWVPDLSVDRLYFSFNTGTPVVYAFGGTISLRWQPQIFGTPLKISAATSLDMAKPPNKDTASGKLEGLFSINSLELTAGMTLGVPEQTYQFKVKFGDLWFQAYTSWRGEAEKRHQVITLQLGGVTVGEILEYLVNLAAPTLGYSLDPPWDVLNRIELSRFTLTLDPQESLAELVYAANADLVFMRLDTIGVRYRRGAKSGVSLIVTGSLLGQRYDGDDLSWDVINESPPPLPGQGETFIQLRYIGLGQRVQLTSLPDMVAATLDLLKGELKEVRPDQNPLTGQGVEWSTVSQWLIGLDVGLLDTVDLGIVFNDPWLYGLSISLGGEKAGSLSGLRFEILYKKISDTVGMFRIELTLPEAYRTFEFGEVSVTLGVVVIEIYTNGNFKIDLGFPYNRSFARSFTVQVFPFIGRGGIYFGLLNGTTSRRVPRITNGNFAPVIELGVGLAVGVGKEIHVGPLSGGIYVQVEVIFEGVLGWFHPAASGGATATYYWAQGVAAIHGKLYGSVDFAVIKVSVTLEAYAAATVTLEAYRPTIFRLQVRVSAEAEVKILFVRITFSFEVGLDVSFELGQERATPWILAADQSQRSLPTPNAYLFVNSASALSRGGSNRRAPLPRRRPERRRAVLLAEHVTRLRARAQAAADGETAAMLSPNWQPTKPVFSDSPRTAGVIMLPCFTVGDVPLSWTGTPPDNPSPVYRFAMELFALTGATPDALTAAQARTRSAAMAAHARDADDLDALAADILIQGLLLYALYAIPDGPQSPTDKVTAGQLIWLAGVLDDPAAAAAGFKSSVLAQFFNANIHLAITGMPSETLPDQSGMAVAVPPFLNWTSPQTGPVNFAADNKIGPLYLWGVQKSAALFSPSGKPPPGPPDDPLADYQSFASHLFSDWCLLIAKSGVREALAALDNRVLPAATATQSLTDLANSLPTATISYPVRPGDTVETVADALGATVDELLFLNPTLVNELNTVPAGNAISIVLGVSPEVLAADNPTAALQLTGLALGDLIVPVAATDTLNSLATLYRTTAAAILGVAGQDVDAKLLAPGTTFDAPATNWTAAPAAFTVLRTAAVFYIRYAGVPSSDTADGPIAAWYAQVLADLNSTLLQTVAIDRRSQELPPEVALQIPLAYQNAAPAPTGYTTVPGDTLARIGAALNLEQNQASTPGATGWPAFRDGVSTITGGYAIPTFAGVAIAPAETAAMLARRTVVNWVSNGAQQPVWSANWSGLATWIGTATILAPLTLITIPDVTTDSSTHYTFASLGAAYGLSLTELGGRLADIDGLLTGQTLLVRHLPADTVQSLLNLVTTRSISGIAAEASRFLFSGQQIPLPVKDKDEHVHASADEFSPLFDQSRQQWNLAVNSSDPTGVALSLQLFSQVGWITLLESTSVQAGEDLAALRTRAPAAFAPGVNRALDAGRVPPAGAIIHTAEATELSYSVTNAEVLAQVPVTALAWPPYIPPAPVDVKGQAPVTYGLSQHIALQTAIALPVPGFDVTKNTLSVHPFPPSLLERARAKTTTAYLVYAGQPGTDNAAPVANWTFGCLVSFTVRRLSDAPGAYQLVGAAVEQMPLLLELVKYLKDSKTPAGTIAAVAMAPAATAADPAGLALIDGDAWLIKSNLSTETVPPSTAVLAAAPTDGTPPLCRADTTNPANFALLLWEGSSVGGIGYTFGVNGGLSDGAFDANDQATLQLVVICGAQQSSAPSGRTLLPFNTAVLAVDQGIADGATLFAEAAHDQDHSKDDPSEFIAQALLPAGSAGFTLTLTRPVLPVGGGGEASLQQQYSLVVATAATSAECPFAVPASGLPATPQASDGKSIPTWRREEERRFGAPRDPAPKTYWAYETVLPIYRFGPTSVAPVVAGLPAPTDDPYRGLGPASTAPQVDFAIGFGDVLGNRSDGTDDAALSVPVGYTDPLNGPTTWPAVNSYYGVAKASGTVTLSITFAAKAQALMPGTDQRGDSFYEAAIRQRELYAAIYYQYVQPNLTQTVKTTLQNGATLTLQGAAALPVLAAGGFIVAAGAVGYRPVMPSAGKLSDIISNYGIGWEALATVNAAIALVDIFGAGTALTVPAYAVMASGDTAQSIAAVSRPGWPAPTASDILNAAPNKNDLPLRSGAILSYPPRAVTLASPAPTLAVAATSAATNAGWLAADSELDLILAANFTFTIDGVSVTVGQTPVPNGSGMVQTFAQAVAAFLDAGIHTSSYQLGELSADATGLLIAGATAHTGHFAVTGEATLADNSSGASTADLIANNLATPDLYDAGALIYLGGFGSGSPPTVTPGQTDTLAGFARRYACPPVALLAANTNRNVIANTKLAIPGAVTLPASDAISSPYTIRSTDILSGIAVNFDLQPANDKTTALAERNRNMPGTVTQGLTFDVTVGSTPVSINTTGLRSFAAVLAQVQITAPAATMADVAAAFNVAGRLATGGLLVCPPVLLASTTKPSGIPTLYGVSASAFALANAGVTGLVAAGVVLSAPDPGLPTVTTTSYDTFNSVVGRFNALYVAAGRSATATVANVVNANRDSTVLAANARGLLPPADIVLSTTLSASGPYPSGAFPLTVELIVSRPANLVLDGFKGTNVEIAAATIAAPAAAASAEGSMTFDAFAKALVAALPNLRLATAKMPDHAADLWAVDFDSNGITSVDVFRAVQFGQAKLARMIALAPLYGYLVSRAQVPISPLVKGSLDPSKSVKHDYQGIDVEVWAARFLSDFERLLSPAPAAAINAIAGLQPQFVSLMSAKAQLQTAIPADLASVFKVNPNNGPTDPRAVTDPNLAAGLTEAKRVFGQTLGVSLSAGWSTAAIVQYDATVDSNWTRDPDPAGTAALYGQARATEPDSSGGVDNPPWRLAAGKVSLSDTAPFLTLPLSVSDPGAQSHIALDLTYAVSNLEIHRQSVDVAPGYTRSDWLAMTPVLTGSTVPAALQVDLGPTDVPIPLKAFPALPLIISQTGLADSTVPPTLATAALWTFRLVYSHEHAAQDHVAVTAEFNLEPPDDAAAMYDPTEDLFTSLAQYIAVADDLNGLLAGLTDASRGVDTATLTAAVTTFASLANDIGDLWNTRLPNTPSGPEGGDDWIANARYPYSAVITYQSGTPRRLASYTLTQLTGGLGPALDWPQVECQTPDGRWVTLIGQTPVGSSRAYLPPPDTEILIGAWPRLALSWPALNVGVMQNARVKLEVVRNIDLLGSAGPATAQAFVYRTATVTATDIVTPAITRTAPLPMTGATVQAALQSAFDALFPPANRRSDLKLTFGLFYGYTLVPGPDPLISELAAGLIPDTTLNSQTASIIAGALDTWQGRVKPNPNGGLWVVSLMLYSSFDPGKRVLLSLDRLSYALA